MFNALQICPAICLLGKVDFEKRAKRHSIGLMTPLQKRSVKMRGDEKKSAKCRARKIIGIIGSFLT